MPQSIEGGVVIINTLSTKNNGNYPLVMAESVEMKNGKNVEDEITEITENISGIINDADINQSSTWSSQNIVSRLCPPFTTEGAIVTCNPVESSRLNAVVQIEPVQEGEGDPSPENVRPIRGWEAVNVFRYGKNLFPNFIKDTDYPGGSTVKVNADGSITIHKVAGESINQSAKIALPAGECIIWNGLDSGNKIYLQIGWSTAAAATLSTAAITYKHSGGEIDLYLYSDTQTTGDITLFPTLIPSDKELLYKPYHGETFTVALGQTVYGGTLDVGSGMLTVTNKSVTVTGTGDFTLIEIPSWSIAGKEYAMVTTNTKDRAVGYDKLICDKLKVGSVSTSGNVWSLMGNSGGYEVYFKVPGESYEHAKRALIDLAPTIVYELKNPVTAQLTPQEIRALSGINTLYADAGDVAVSGYSDPNTIINSLADRIAALESATSSLIINELDYN